MNIDPNICVSHIRRAINGEIDAVQTNTEHSLGVAQLTEQFASQFGMGSWGYVLGLLHDKGKENKEFQEYIRDVNGIKGHEAWTYDGKAHAYVGAILAKKSFGKQALNIFCNPIAGHHRGLMDYYELESLVLRELPSEINQIGSTIGKLDSPKLRLDRKEWFHYLTRMLFSCLVDADYLDTERFMNIDSFNARSTGKSLSDLLPILEDYLSSLNVGATHSEVNAIRRQVQNICRESSTKERGFYSLTVPTGGGKTLSSLLWAMRHAVHHKMNRIIIAIPYTSIIVQTASVLKGIFGEENVLEHHTNYNPSQIKDPQLALKAKLATENWNYPIVVTTNVQLFESLFSNRPSVCRKLHNIANSVIILDEVQTLPTDYLKPIVDAMKAYQHMFGVSLLFTTASQPLLSGFIEGCNPMASFPAIKEISELIPSGMKLHEKLKRVDLEIDNSGKTYDEVANMLIGHERVLCIVNTRQDAKEIYSRLPKEGITIHLSRMMCPKHITETIGQIRKALDNNCNEVIRVVATQLIEAGVDIDFPVVFRQEAGLDSILQAAGRCNREGKLPSATTFVFSLSKEHPLHGTLKDANCARLNMGDNFNWFASDTMVEYFKQLYSCKETFDRKDISGLLGKYSEICFESASNEFNLIENDGVDVIVNMDNSMELVNEAKVTGINYSLMKSLSQYTVTIHQKDFEKLKSFKFVEEFVEGLYVVSDKAQYKEDIGLCINNHWLEEILICGE